MIQEHEVRAALESVLDPEIGKPITELGMVKGVEVQGGTVRVDVLLTIAACPLKDRIESDVAQALAPVAGVEKVEVRLGEMTDEQRQGMVTQLRGEQPQIPSFFTDGSTEVIAVASGKGGVGKSSVTANLAVAMAAEGRRVGILDADVWGFSIPRMMGVTDQKPVGFNDMILPLEAHGVKVISMGFFVSDDTPVIWRGPMLHKALQQFIGDVYWGDLDVLLIDMPPGTGDVSLSLASFLPTGSILVVTTPQDTAHKVAERAGRMAQHPNVKMKLLGVIENMAGMACPHCGEITDIFGTGGGRKTAEALGVDLLGSVPIQVSLREGADAGTPVVVQEPDSPAGAAFREIAAELGKRTASRVGRSLPLTVAPGR